MYDIPMKCYFHKETLKSANLFQLHNWSQLFLQPALLYLVPACIGIPGVVALIKGDINALLK